MVQIGLMIMDGIKNSKVIETEYFPLCKHCGKEIKTPTACYNSGDDSLYHPPPDHICAYKELQENGENWEKEDALEMVELKVRSKRLSNKVRFDLKEDELKGSNRSYFKIFRERYYVGFKVVPESEDTIPLGQGDCYVKAFESLPGSPKYHLYPFVRILDKEYPVESFNFIELDPEIVSKLRRAAKQKIVNDFKLAIRSEIEKIVDFVRNITV